MTVVVNATLRSLARRNCTEQVRLHLISMVHPLPCSSKPTSKKDVTRRVVEHWLKTAC